MPAPRKKPVRRKPGSRSSRSSSLSESKKIQILKKVEDQNVKFMRLQFTDIFGITKNVEVPSSQFRHALDGGVMLVVVGNILCFTLGVYIYSGRVHWLDVLKTPILIAVLVGFVFSTLQWSIPQFVRTPLSMLGQVAIPLMLFSLGVRLTRVSLNDSKQGLVMGLLCPIVGVLCALALAQIIPLSDIHRNTLILFGVLPPAVVNFMLAEQYSRQPTQVASMVMIGNLISLLSIPLILIWLIL